MRFNLRAGLLTALGTAMFAGACGQPPPPETAPPEVYVTPVVQQDVPIYLELVGQTEGHQDVEVRARVEGFLESMEFREGSFVRRGDVL
jgi:membrane fusion protein (multidrug efflux system)